MGPREEFPAEDLRISISSVGVLEAVIFHQGTVVDGRKRQRLAEEYALEYPTLHLDTAEECAPVLWRRHPDRCVELFPCETIVAASELYKCDLASVSRFYGRPSAEPMPSGTWRERDAKRAAEHRRIRMGAKLWDRMGVIAKGWGWSRAYFIRVACAYALEHVDAIRLFAMSEEGTGLRLRSSVPKKNKPKAIKRRR